MSNHLVDIICEGQTEAEFVKRILNPYLRPKGFEVLPIILSKKGQKGGNVKFCRAENDIYISLRKTSCPIVSTFVDYYGIKEWPGLNSIPQNSTPEQIAGFLNSEVKRIICAKYDKYNPQNRFIPFVMVHEFETLLFSNPSVLAEYLHIDKTAIDNVLSEFGSPERINNSRQTAPAKRLENWCDGHYRKTTMGITIAERIGIPAMREACPLFDAWLREIEQKASA